MTAPNATENEPAKLPRLLIADDDPAILSQLGLALRAEYDIRTAESGKRAWSMICAEPPDLLALDLALDDNDPESGFLLLEQCLALDPLMKVILVTGNDDEANALRAIQQGAADFFAKPIDLEELRVLLRRVLSRARLERQNAALTQALSREQRLGALLGQSPLMRALFKNIERVAQVDISVLILGESGTGKELAAKEIRRLGPRAVKPFVSINCAAIPENLLESELFGHEKGAFTGAHVARAGRLELAQSGIVFLDEVGELPLALQVKLLRFLQDHQVERIGGRGVINLDVRVLAATSRDLESEVKNGRFREDLYYRLSVVNLHLPPLRERWEDIPLLVQYFLDRFGNEFGRGTLSLSSRAKLALQQHKWPGNVRELEHRIQKAVLLAAGPLIEATDLELKEPKAPEPLSLKAARDRAERQTAIDALRRTGGNVSRAAEMLGISRPSLYQLLTRRQISADEYRYPSDNT